MLDLVKPTDQEDIEPLITEALPEVLGVPHTEEVPERVSDGKLAIGVLISQDIPLIVCDGAIEHVEDCEKCYKHLYDCTYKVYKVKDQEQLDSLKASNRILHTFINQ